MTRRPTLRWAVTAALLVVAVIHAVPLAGVLGAGALHTLYGISADEPNLQILLRHRAVLFGMLALFLAVAAFRPAWHGGALLLAAISVVSFLLLAMGVGDYNAALAGVVRADWVALGLLLAGALAWWMGNRRAG